MIARFGNVSDCFKLKTIPNQQALLFLHLVGFSELLRMQSVSPLLPLRIHARDSGLGATSRNARHIQFRLWFESNGQMKCHGLECATCFFLFLLHLTTGLIF